MTTGLVTEFTKLVHSTVVRATTILVVLGISLICCAMLFAVHTDDPQLAAKLGPLIDPGGWAGYFTVAIQVTGAAGFARVRRRTQLAVQPRIRRRHHHRPVRDPGLPADDRCRETPRLPRVGPRHGRRSPAHPDRPRFHQRTRKRPRRRRTVDGPAVRPLRLHHRPRHPRRLGSNHSADRSLPASEPPSAFSSRPR